MPTDPSLDRALHAVADPTRRRILQTLKTHVTSTTTMAGHAALPSWPKRTKGSSHRNPSFCAGDIQTQIGLSQPTISHHMAILVKAGLVDSVKRGQWRWYRRNEGEIRKLVKTLRAKL